MGLLDDEDTIAAEINESGEFRESVYEILLKIEDKLRKIEIAPGGSGGTKSILRSSGGRNKLYKIAQVKVKEM